MNARIEHLRPGEGVVEVDGPDIRNFSLCNLLRHIADPSVKTAKAAELELDISSTIRRGQGDFSVPLFRAEHLQRAMSTTGTGIGLVPTDTKIAPGFVELIAQASRTLELGAQTVTDLVGKTTFAQPRAVTVSAVAEDTPPADSEVTLASVSLDLTHSLQVNVPITLRLLLQSNPAADAFIEQHVATALAAAVDSQGYTTANTAASANAAAGLAYANAVSAEQKLIAAGVDINGWLVDNNAWETMRGSGKADSLIEDDLAQVNRHRILGYRAFPYVTGIANSFTVGNWRRLVYGFFGPMIVDRLQRAADAAKGQILMHFEVNMGTDTMEGGAAFVKQG